MDTTSSYTLDVITRQDNNRTDICFGCLCNIKTDKLFVINSVDDIIGTIMSNKIRNIYIQDFSYVASYLYYYLISNNIKYNDSNKFNFDGRMAYTAFSSEGGAMYYIKLFFKDGQQFCCEFKSSRNKSMSLLRDLQTSFNIDIDYKIKDDDNTLQLSSCDDLSEDIMENTCARAVALAHVMKKLLSSGNTKLTIGSDAMRQWQKLDGMHFPSMPRIDDELDSKFRLAYRGGFTWLNKIFKNKELGHGFVMDVNSLYPFVMRSFPLPCGEPHHTYEVPSNTLYIAHVIIHGATLKEGGIPCISNMNRCDGSKGSVISNEYLDVIDNMDCWLTNYDLELVMINYKVEITPVEYYYFDKVVGCFDNFIDTNYEIKKTSRGAKRQIAKLNLDSLYGRFGIKIGRHKTMPVIEDGVLKFVNSEVLKDNTIRYLPMAIFITSIARYLIIRTALEIIDRVVYIDTDGIHIVGDDIPDVFDIGKELGEWKIEAEFNRAKYIGLKTYIHDEVNGKTVVKMSGAPEEVRKNINWDNFKTGTTVPGKIMMRSIPGGYIRYKTKYKIYGC